MSTSTLGQVLENTRWVASGLIEDSLVIGRKLTGLLEKVDVLGIIKKLNELFERVSPDDRIYEGIDPSLLTGAFAHSYLITSKPQFNTLLKTDSLVEALAIFAADDSTRGNYFNPLEKPIQQRIQKNAIQLVEERASRFSLLGIANKKTVLTFAEKFIAQPGLFLFYTKTHLDNIQQGSGNPFDLPIEL